MPMLDLRTVGPSSLRILLANRTLARYPQGGGHWTCFLQYLVGLSALGHEVFWLEILLSSGNPSRDRRLINIFFNRLRKYGFAGRCALVLCRGGLDEIALEKADAYGMSPDQIRDLARSTDLLWNFSCSLRQPFLSLFHKRVLIDLDPGYLQACGAIWNMGIQDHHIFLSVGTNFGEPDCQIPDLNLKWLRFHPFVYLPMWTLMSSPTASAPFTSVTQWTWETLTFEGRLLSNSKRDGYLRYIDLPAQTARNFELAANINPKDTTGDRELLTQMGWNLAHPHWVARSPSLYQSYLLRSRAEFSCAKPIYRELNTGWVSDRSVAYLASGRPVLAENTGFSKHLPTGRGLLTFKNLPEAVAGVREIDGNYPLHQRAARELAEEYFSSAKWLPAMLSACGW